MSWESIANEYLIPIWFFGLLFWAIWFTIKISSFKRQTRLQRAISKPQLSQLRTQLFRSIFWIFLPSFSLFFLPYGESTITGAITTTLFCFIPLFLTSLGALEYEIWFFRRANFPFTDQAVAPIPEPPPPPPHAGKSFEDLSKELEQAMKDLEENR
ncbi:hypothetical protein [Candidatus Leptofilum sp.]|uniref:hypothetical protein n=1 Tax=Candidatus Leptofilum sp. TaxID=3241576 RepID=UPI003B58EECC